MAKKKAAKSKALVFSEPPPPEYSISDPALAEFLGLSGLSGVDITEERALGLTAIFRAVSLISGTIAGLPLKVYEGSGPSRKQVEGHWLTEKPCGPYDMSAFSFIETLMLHLLLHSEGYLKSVYTAGGELVGLWPVHPLAITRVAWVGADKQFTVGMSDGSSETYMTGDITQVLGISSNGLRGLSPLTLFRQSLNTMRAGEMAANRSFTGGALIAGLVTTEEDVDGEEAKVIKASLNAKMMGAEHAGDIAFVNRALKFTPWTMTNADAQFLESRRFGIEEAARIYGLPVNLLSATGAVSNWGTGVAEANLGLQKYVLTSWTSRIESALKAVLPPGQFAEFDYAGLLQGSPKDEIELLIAQVNAGILTKDEARAIRNLPPLPKEPMPEPPEPGDPMDQNQTMPPKGMPPQESKNAA